MAKENKYIAVVKDPNFGSYAYRGVDGKKETLKTVEYIKSRGIKEKDISVLPVLDSKDTRLSNCLKVLGIVCSVLDIALYIYRERKKRKAKKESTEK